MANHKVSINLERGPAKEREIRQDLERSVKTIGDYEEKKSGRRPTDDEIRKRVSGYAESDNQKGKWK